MYESIAAKAERLFVGGQVQYIGSSSSALTYAVRGDHGKYCVHLRRDGEWACDCAWGSKAKADRPCSHVQAARLSAERERNKENTMAWIKILPGQEAMLTLLTGTMTQRLEHWADNRSVACVGQGCQYCLAGNRARNRYSLDCTQYGQAATWEFPEAVRQQLQTIFPGPDALKGSTVRVRRIGNQYVVDAGNATEPPARSWQTERPVSMAPTGVVWPERAQPQAVPNGVAPVLPGPSAPAGDFTYVPITEERLGVLVFEACRKVIYDAVSDQSLVGYLVDEVMTLVRERQASERLSVQG